MKNIYSKMLLLMVILAGVLSACDKEDLPNGGQPKIDYIRVTKPESSDSLLVAAYQGTLIAIMGENLAGVQQIWFNDQKSSLTPTYITNTTIMVSVPSVIPQDITNKMRLVFSDGTELLHDFEVQISEPTVAGMECEYVPTGGIATIRGDYFYEPLTVSFAGGVTGEIVSVTDQLIQVRVPDGAQPGQVTIKTNFGETKSDFWFRDNRNVFINSDPFMGWWGASFVVTAPTGDDPAAISGNYIRVKQSISGWAWKEVAGGPPDAMGDISKNIPDEAILKPADYNLKFELNTKKPYSGNVIKLTVGLNDFNNDQYTWLPPYDTKGEWKTVIIPFEELAAAYEASGVKMAVSDKGYFSRILFHGPGDLDCDMSFDNFRVVPKVLKK